MKRSAQLANTNNEIKEIVMAGGPVAIRRAQPRDAEATLTLLKGLAEHEDSSQHVHLTLKQLEEYLHRDDVIIFLAEVDGSQIGYSSALRRTYFWGGSEIIALDDLYVRASHRNKRVGEHLMKAMAGQAAHDGLTVMWEVTPTNVAGQRFYSKLGAKLSTKVIATWTPEHYGFIV
ncbi:GNAT family N-acetyltransferase [Arthrobacter sp. UYCu712]|uniref:GNAT family N-acetyltransferase n=1 Tax=Arthrobacter sp. UYCu712 TaxID=3156340 RepID=UPI003390DD42